MSRPVRSVPSLKMKNESSIAAATTRIIAQIFCFYPRVKSKRKAKEFRNKILQFLYTKGKKLANMVLRVHFEEEIIDGNLIVPKSDGSVSKEKSDWRIAALFMGIETLTLANLDCNNSLVCLHRLQLKRMPQSMGLFFSDSKVFLIGGDFVSHGGNRISKQYYSYHAIKYPRNVYTYDLRKKRGWKKGKPLIGAKPNPRILQVERKLYILAGSSRYHRALDKIEIPNPAFEMLDLSTGVCSKLPDPPFCDAYYHGYYPEFSLYFAFCTTIYVGVRLPAYTGDSVGEQHLFSFDLKNQLWHEHCDPSDYPIVVDNIIECSWDCSSHIYQGKLYMLITTPQPARVCVYDLAAKRDSAAEDEWEFHRETDRRRLGKCVPDIVQGLDEVTGQLPCDDFTSGNVFPLDDSSNKFCFISSFINPKSESSKRYSILMCNFELIKEHNNSGLHAKNVSTRVFSFDGESWGEPLMYCNLKEELLVSSEHREQVKAPFSHSQNKVPHVSL